MSDRGSPAAAKEIRDCEAKQPISEAGVNYKSTTTIRIKVRDER